MVAAMLLAAGCATARPARAWIEVRPGQSPESCAFEDAKDNEFNGAKHIHATYFGWARGKILPGDRFEVTAPGQSAEKGVMDVEPNEASTLMAPLGLGFHAFTWRWLRADGTLVAEAPVYATVWDCGHR